MEPDIHVIIVAAGSGTRFGGELPKQFALLEGKPVLAHTTDAFRRILPEAEITVVLSGMMTEYWKRVCTENDYPQARIVEGGTSRWESVKNGITSLQSLKENDIILVHDGARPLVTGAIVNEIVKGVVAGHDGAIPVVEVTDSIRSADGSHSHSIDRSKLRAVQTPQGFNASKLSRAFTLPYSKDFTDEATVMEKAGFTDIVLTRGDFRNIKITRPIDLKIAESFLKDERPERL